MIVERRLAPPLRVTYSLPHLSHYASRPPFLTIHVSLACGQLPSKHGRGLKEARGTPATTYRKWRSPFEQTETTDSAFRLRFPPSNVTRGEILVGEWWRDEYSSTHHKIFMLLLNKESFVEAEASKGGTSWSKRPCQTQRHKRPTRTWRQQVNRCILHDDTCRSRGRGSQTTRRRLRLPKLHLA